MLRAPSKRKTKHGVKKLNLIPILDAVFIFIFFLLMSANFIKIFEISSDVPIVSSGTPRKIKKKPLALTLKITSRGLTLYSGIPSRPMRSFGKKSDGQYDLNALHLYLVDLKKRYKTEKTIVFEPLIDIVYEDLVKIMDSVRILRNIDDAIYIKQIDGSDEKIKTLFDNIIFGNIQS